jgi:uncharacterized membrane protein
MVAAEVVIAVVLFYIAERITKHKERTRSKSDGADAS